MAPATMAAPTQTPAHSPVTVKEAVGVFNDLERLDGAITDLQQCGFNRAELSVSADSRRIQAETGRGVQDVREIEDDPDVPRTVFVSKASLGDAEGVLVGVAVYVGAVFAAGIAIAAGAGPALTIVVVAIAAAIGGGLGYLLARRLAQRYADSVQECSRRGLVLWVNLRRPDQETCALDVLNRHGAQRVHIHEVPQL